jgi:hypothetical protein
MKTILNRLKSIYYDSKMVDQLCLLLPDAELVANLRCGIWYCKNQDVKTCYFKSTDGHNKKWDFNLCRLNINLLETAYAHSSIIIVDSTTNERKVYPDALSKTIPIWIYMMNMYIDNLFHIKQIDMDKIELPRFVHENEKKCIKECIKKNREKWLTELMNYIDNTTTNKIIEIVRSSGNKRLVPMFVSSLDLFDNNMYNKILLDNNIPIICLSVGNHDRIYMENQIDRKLQYILGAGDDEEMWSNGLTSELFWKNHKRYLDYEDDETIINAVKLSINDNYLNKEVPAIYLIENLGILSRQPKNDKRDPNMFSIRIITNVANFTKNIGIFDLKSKNCLLSIIDKMNTTIENLYKYNINHIEFICNDFRVSLAIMVSIMVKFKNIIFNRHLNLSDDEPITKQYIRRIISYVYQFSGIYHIPRDFCKQLNKYYINV